MAKQNFRCAGCGSKVEMGYAKRYHYCEYFGKYFCPCCHSNDRSYVPGHILRNWNFAKFPVSHFAFDLLKRIFNDPLFSIEASSSSVLLYRKVAALDEMRSCRTQLFHLNAFISTCTRPGRPQNVLNSCAAHWFSSLSSVHVYSLHELVQVKKNELLPMFRGIVRECRDHISHCELCLAKGFICEICRKVDDVIFPFDLSRVVLCSACGSCFHKSCFDPNTCPKCVRLLARKKVQDAKEHQDAS